MKPQLAVAALTMACLMCVTSKPRHSPKYFGNCNLLFNELYTGNPITEFFEICKLCAAGQEVAYKNMVGYAANILALGQDQNITFFFDFSGQNLHKSRSGLECFVVGGDGVAQANKKFSDSFWSMSNEDGSALPSGYSSTYVFLLLHLNNKVPRSTWEKLKPLIENDEAIGKPVTPDFLTLVSQYIQDAVVLGADCSETDSCQTIRSILPEFVDSTKYTLSYPPSDLALDGISRCGEDNAPLKPESFKHSLRTPGQANQCAESNAFILQANSGLEMPFSFWRHHLQHHAQQMIINALTFFKFYEDVDIPVNGDPSVVVGKILNLGSRSVRQIERRYNSNNVLKTPSFSTKGNCPKLKIIDNFNKDIIRNIIMRIYKSNKAPFLKDVYHQFLLAVENCEHVQQDTTFEEITVRESHSEIQVPDETQHQETNTQASQEDMRQAQEPAAGLIAATSAPMRLPGLPHSSARSARRQAGIDYATGLRIVDQPTKKKRRTRVTHNMLSLSTFRRVILQLGFVFGKINTRLAVVQRPDVVNLRGKYLRRLRENRASPNPKPLIYTDETWADSNFRFTKAWVPRRITSYDEYELYSYGKHKVGRAPRLIVIGAASDKTGVLHEVTKVYKVKKGDAGLDYHENINQRVYMKWLNELLDYLDRVDPGVSQIIIIDNAPYHSASVAPKSTATKKVMYDWLEKEKAKDPSISLRPIKEMLRDELWDAVKKRKVGTSYYEVDILVKSRGHEILRLPPYNCDLNAIEFLWAHIKRTLVYENTQQNIDAIKIVAERILKNYPVEIWKKMADHVVKRGDVYWEEDNFSEDVRSDLNIVITDDPDDDGEEVVDSIPRNTFPRQIDVDTMEDTSWLMEILANDRDSYQQDDGEGQCSQRAESKERAVHSAEIQLEGLDTESVGSAEVDSVAAGEQAEGSNPQTSLTTPKRQSTKRRSGKKRRLDLK